MPKYVWSEWGISPIADGVKHAEEIKCPRCNQELTIDDSRSRNWREQIVGYSKFAPKTSEGSDIRGVFVLQCRDCQAFSWFHIELAYWKEYHLAMIPGWPTEE